jgi:hypothetical protein
MFPSMMKRENKENKEIEIDYTDWNDAMTRQLVVELQFLYRPATHVAVTPAVRPCADKLCAQPLSCTDTTLQVYIYYHANVIVCWRCTYIDAALQVCLHIAEYWLVRFRAYQSGLESLVS